MADTPLASDAPAMSESVLMTAEGAEGMTAIGGGKPRHTFNAPRGTIRALLALCVAGSAYWLIAHPDILDTHHNGLLPEDLVGALLIVLGYYFADRAGREDDTEVGRAPMWLPTGTVRAALVMGFVAAVGFLVWNQYQETDFDFFMLPAAGVIISISAFLFGRLGRVVLKGFKSKGRTVLSTVLGDVKGLVGVVAGVGTLVVYCMPELLVNVPMEWRGRFLELFPGVISFYFGTR